MKAVVLVTLILLSLVSFSFGQKQNLMPESDYPVILAIIGHGNFVILNETRSERFSQFGDQNLSKLFEILLPENIADFNEKNKQSFSLEDKFPIKAPYTLLGRSDLNQFFDKNNLFAGWESFHKKFPEAGGYHQT